MRIYLKYYLVLLFIFVAFPLFAQTPEDIEKKIEWALIQDRGTSTSESDIHNAFDILKMSKKMNYERGIVNGYLFIAELLSKLGEYEQSMKYLHFMQKHSWYLKTHPYEDFYRLRCLAYNYHDMGISSEANKAFHQAANVIHHEKDPFERNFGLFILLADSYLITANEDSLYLNLLKSAQILTSTDYQKRRGNKHTAEIFRKQDWAFLHTLFGDHFLIIGKPDSARHYFQASLHELKGTGDCQYEVYAYNGLGNAYDSLRHYSLAIAAYLKAIEAAKKYKRPDIVKEAYQSLSKVYRKTGNKTQALEYRELHEALSDSLEKQKSKGRNVVILNLLKDHEADLEESRRNNQLIIVGITGISILLVGIGIWLFFRYRKQKEQLLAEHTQKLTSKEQEAQHLNEQVHQSLQILQEKEQHTQQLQQKVNESFHELVTLAQQNHPNFYARFQEVYPELHRKLLSIDENLELTELTLCAYVYLDFSSKDIAEYSFRSVRTIQNRKYTLRKKLGVEAWEDLYVWMKELTSKTD